MPQRCGIGFGRPTNRQACRATEMDVTMVGLQNAGKTSLLRVLSVCVAKLPPLAPEYPHFPDAQRYTGGRRTPSYPAHSSISFLVVGPFLPHLLLGCLPCRAIANEFVVGCRVENSRLSKPVFFFACNSMPNCSESRRLATFTPFPIPPTPAPLLVRSAAGTSADSRSCVARSRRSGST